MGCQEIGRFVRVTKFAIVCGNPADRDLHRSDADSDVLVRQVLALKDLRRLKKGTGRLCPGFDSRRYSRARPENQLGRKPRGLPEDQYAIIPASHFSVDHSSLLTAISQIPRLLSTKSSLR